MDIYFNEQIDDWDFNHIVYTDEVGPDPSVSARFGIIDDEGQRIQIDVLASAGLPCFKDARCVDQIAYFGFGHCIFIFDTKTRELVRHQVDGYFGHMYDGSDFEHFPVQLSVIVTSASEALAFSRQGKLLRVWSNLGIDGVTLNAVNESQIEGEGECDPPGGWRKFALTLDHGEFA
ncbi:hypothetical protein GM658_18130 [Pseudoduganella eburnea]|uniref:Uncharacterized protein n=1 Tax=Massilia eburnea TaxID=1776165 RepID=A0A6L6QK94_9BURK|nr:hypothetical protein [Massilia eburnea]MTW12530.1 hypothetical protein [Massilia eburnea]